VALRIDSAGTESIEGTDSTDSTESVGRCAVHPSRPAVDDCPACGRPRCGADRSAFGGRGGGCAACRGGRLTERATASALERLVRAALVAFALGLFGGWIGTEYIGAGAFADIVPGLVGLACASSAAAAARTTGRGRLDVAARALGAFAAVLGTALAYKLVPGGGDPWSPAGTVLPTYAAAVVGAAVSRLLR